MTHHIRKRIAWQRRMILTALLFFQTACSLESLALEAGKTATQLAVEDRSFDHALSDTAIRTQINHHWFQAHVDLLTYADFMVHEGHVLLTGTVPDPQMKDQAEHLIMSIGRVKKIYNEIQTNKNTDLIDYAKDNMMTAKIEAKLLLDKEINAANFRVDTENQTVYILGTVTHEHQKQRVLAYIYDLSSVRRLVDYIRILPSYSSENVTKTRLLDKKQSQRAPLNPN